MSLRLVPMASDIGVAHHVDAQSALAPIGVEALRVAFLTRTLWIGAACILLLVLVCVVLALRGRGGSRRWVARQDTILMLGMGLPIVVLTALLVWGFVALRAGSVAAAEAEPDLRIEVVGRQWWWKVTYAHSDGSETVSANEIRIPVGRSVELSLASDDVIHSFWVPALAGKVDMIPGRVNRLRLRAERSGLLRGQCAEYCGGAHALMAFDVVVMAPDEFDAWLARERRPRQQVGADASGEHLFIASGCGSCHRVRGTTADADIGPDLTHVGRRLHLGAGVLPNSADTLARWLQAHRIIKPDNRMPPFPHLDDAQRAAIARWLAQED